jgi:signal transduction histidine kinase
VTKPVSPPELLGRVQAALGLRRARSVAREFALVKAQRDRLMRQQLQKERLSALLVHDLKSPLNAISLLAQSVLRARTLQPADREAVAEIRAQVTRLSNMVMNLLDISKARDGQLVAHRECVDLRSLCESVLSDFELKASSRNVRLQLTLFETTLDADPHLLRRLFENLLDNALRYTPPGSSVMLHAAPRAGSVELRLADEGPGIPAELRERVFDAFTQVEAGTLEGRGLGLAFCRLAVAAHQGRIWVEDGSPGTIMCVALPRPHSSQSGFYPALGPQ